MGASAEAIARRFEAKVRDARATAEQLIERGLIAYIDEHFGSIRRAVGHAPAG